MNIPIQDAHKRHRKSQLDPEGNHLYFENFPKARRNPSSTPFQPPKPRLDTVASSQGSKEFDI